MKKNLVLVLKCAVISRYSQNPRWPPELVGGAANFASSGLRTKISMAISCFFGPRNRLGQLPSTSDH